MIRVLILLTALTSTVANAQTIIRRAAAPPAADVEFCVDQRQLPTTAGQVTFSCAGNTKTVKAALYFAARATTNGTALVKNAWSIGATDGTRQVVVAGKDEHAVTSTDADNSGSITEVVLLQNDAAHASWDFTCHHHAFGAGSATIDCDVVDGSQPRVMALLLAGNDVAVYVDSLKGNQAASASRTKTIGFDADAIFFWSIDRDLTKTIANHMVAGVGAVVDDGSLTQVSVGLSSRFSVAAASAYAWTKEMATANKKVGQTDGDRGEFTITAIGATSFTHQKSASSLAYYAGFLAVDLTGGTYGASLIKYDTPTATGNHSTSGASVGPGVALDVVSGMASYATTDGIGGDLAGFWQIGLTDCARAYSWNTATDDGASTTDTYTLVNNRMTHAKYAAQSDYLVDNGALPTCNAGGITRNFTTVPGASGKAFQLILGD